MGWRGFLCPTHFVKSASVPNICPEKSGKSAACWANIGHAARAGFWARLDRLAIVDNAHIMRSGAPLVRAREGRLDDYEETLRARVSGHRQALGRGPVRADQRVSRMSSKDPVAGAASPTDAVVPLEPRAKAPVAGAMPTASPGKDVERPLRAGVSMSKRVGDAGVGGARSPPGLSSAGSGDDLLTPKDILARLRMKSTDPAKWMRRTFNKHGIPYLHVCGKLRATEEQYRLLLDKITCSPSVAVGRTAFSTSVVWSRSATSGSTSRNSVQERVTQMLRRT